MKVSPAAMVMGELRELVVGGVGKTLVAVRRSRLFTVSVNINNTRRHPSFDSRISARNGRHYE